MKKDDIYTIHMIEDGRIYLKNNILHREAGPAFIPNSSVNVYKSLADHALYKIVPNSYINIRELHKFFKESSNIFHFNTKSAQFFLEGVPYERKDFYSIMEKKHINKELNKELPISNMLNRKIKI